MNGKQQLSPNFIPSGNCSLLFGNEVNGLDFCFISLNGAYSRCLQVHYFILVPLCVHSLNHFVFCLIFFYPYMSKHLVPRNDAFRQYLPVINLTQLVI